MYAAITNQIRKATNIVVLTGAGVSTDSGIPDFRSTNGIWEEDRSREYFMSNEYFQKNPRDFWTKYKSIFHLKLAGNFRPNLTHHFIKQLEEIGKEVTVITQNVDGLHKKAGNQKVIEYHGTLTTASCPTCYKSYPLSYILEHAIPYCTDCSISIKPDIVLFGDMITEHEKAEAAIEKADFLLVLGTSLFVTPFNSLPIYATKYCNVPSAIINREPTIMDDTFSYVIHQELKKGITEICNLYPLNMKAQG
ncbi:NAD-dependent deacetylase [Salirhabdus euzebyi]|uniref:protein acetyllysine N-acetyltransferase n=1 Tax=Salirhabdus euzebyi TaxID=394506 RepID=A0A841Q864_9BACI|nr:NAD-dependent protein deacylase [Salirhabdus euzebyi]MBB6454789.1 NAD-dependent deacetylase [Salirhabdus euzebyi]